MMLTFEWSLCVGPRYSRLATRWGLRHQLTSHRTDREVIEAEPRPPRRRSVFCLNCW